jgi:hypothetical protein
METLTEFLKSSTVVDLAFIFVVIMLSVIIVIAAIVMLIVVKRRRPFFILIVVAMFPLVVALGGAGWRYYQAERLMAEYSEMAGEEGSEWRSRFRTEFILMCMTGVPGTVLPILMAVLGIAMKKRPDA